MNKSLVAQIRKKQSLTQEHLAEKAYVTVRTIQRIEAGEEVSSETLRSVSNVLGVTVSELFESVDSTEKEGELMAYSREQQRQFNLRRYEVNAIRLVLWGLVFMVLAISFIYIDSDNSLIKAIRLIIWISLLFIAFGGMNYFVKVFISKKMDNKYPMTIGLLDEKKQQKENDPNLGQLIKKICWLILPIVAVLIWLILYFMSR